MTKAEVRLPKGFVQAEAWPGAVFESPKNPSRKTELQRLDILLTALLLYRAQGEKIDRSDESGMS
ncbi:MAG: hypothetical protein UU21_C0002G0009 [Candidatus Levybacteria bacterium GW2011_GWA2_40_8]|nr:MAG: hypothetical protein UU21_C0002G0009 [Candidatus Levybacteria bacterium GW2011_GWA2_40_8]